MQHNEVSAVDVAQPDAAPLELREEAQCGQRCRFGQKHERLVCKARIAVGLVHRVLPVIQFGFDGDQCPRVHERYYVSAPAGVVELARETDSAPRGSIRLQQTDESIDKCLFC